MSFPAPQQLQVPRPVGADEFRGSSRYELLVKIASGGSASVYVGRVTGSAGFSRLVAVKRAHPHLAHDPAVQKMMRTEARLASGLNHANVVAVQDVEQVGAELLLILDYVEGASLSELISASAHAGKPLPPRVALRVALDACAGLAAVHEIEGRDGRPVGFLHRDVSPQNILVGVDGTARITDFGLAKHICSDASKASGTLQGKLAYLAPEIIDKVAFSVQSDLFAMAVVLWEAVARRRLFQGDTWADTVRKVGLVQPPPLSRAVPGLDPRLDQVVARALAKEPGRRHPTVRAFLQDLEAIGVEQNLIATTSEVAAHVLSVVGDELRRRRALIRPFQPIDDDDDLMTTQTFQNIPRAAAAARTAPPPAP
ncbi:MAG TPA: serine/threonine-protein kinase, partial [Candidatus Nanopelagicales bacterium]|nr:serine/threonine-protein kinase [Candidatus Nanopelagicales bacterium]